jgi:hypothetical protein
LQNQNHLESIYDIQFKQYSEYSSYWHNKSCHLKKSSKILWDEWLQGNTYDSGDTYRMLMGLSFELLFKSFLIAKKINFDPIHDLNKLALQAGLTLNEKESNIFTNLTGYIFWEGKYPTPKPRDTKKKTLYSTKINVTIGKLNATRYIYKRF